MVIRLVDVDPMQVSLPCRLEVDLVPPNLDLSSPTPSIGHVTKGCVSLLGHCLHQKVLFLETHDRVNAIHKSILEGLQGNQPQESL